MSDAVPTPEVVVEETPTEEAPRTFTQEEVNRINAADRRKDREALEALRAEIEALKPKALKADELEAAQMTELEKERKRAEELAAKLADFEQREQAAAALKAKQDAAVAAAKELGYPSVDKALSLAKYLDGDDLTEAAKALFDDFKPAREPLPEAVHDIKPDDPAAKDPFLAGMKAAMKR
jgi:TolA-binding protein